MTAAWLPQVIPGLYTVGKPLAADSRGSFHKIFSDAPPDFKKFQMDEIYWSTSEVGVARGMHLQVPPFQGRKLVFATAGRVLDLVIDLRLGSPTFQYLWNCELSPETAGVLVPAGCAHGFIVVEGPVTLVYAQEGNYSQECDTGVRLTTVGVEMPVDGTVMSQRDRELPELSQFVSPFVFDVSDHIDWGSKT